MFETSIIYVADILIFYLGLIFPLIYFTDTLGSFAGPNMDRQAYYTLKQSA